MLMIDSCHFVSVIEREQGLLKIVSAGSVLPIRKDYLSISLYNVKIIL